MARTKVEFQRRAGDKVCNKWPSLSKKEALSVGWLLLMTMYALAFILRPFVALEVDPWFAASMASFQGLDVVAQKFKTKRSDK